MLEERKSRFEERSRRVRQVPYGRVNFALQPASPFYFRLTCTHDLDQPKLEATNRLLRIAPHLGLALLVMLVENGLIAETRQEALRREQTGRYLAYDTTTHVYEIAPNAPTRDKQHRLYKTVNAFLAADDDTARSLPCCRMARLRVSASSLVVSVAVAVAVAVACARGGRVVSSSRTRHLATSPSRRHAASPSQPSHTHLFDVTVLVTRTPLCCIPFDSFSSYAVLVLLYLYYSRLVAARIFAFPSHYSRIRRAAAPSVISFQFCVC